MAGGDKAFTWLHVSDLHAGMKDADWLWPQTKAQVVADISKMAKLLGPVDLLIFTGDFAQSGSNEQFSQATGILLELLAAIGPQEDPCKVAVIPGNHDLSRPKASDPGALLLRQWEDQPAVREDTLSGKKSVYKTTLDFAFHNYTSWVSSLTQTGVPVLMGESGTFAGDFADRLQLEGGTVGVVGLNSTWMQLDGGDYEGKIVVDPAQLIRVTQGDPDKWLSQNATNILLTHHPRSWLTKSAQSHWDGEIRTPSRFALHMHGHMHEPDAISLAHGGGPLHHSVQAASLCGLERYGTGPNAVGRTHGYSFGKLTFTGGAPQIQVWPRRLELLSGGYRKFVADYRANLGEDDASYILGTQQADNLARAEPHLAIEVATEGMSRLAIAPTSPSAILEKVRSVIPSVRAAHRVRLVEQRLSQAAIQDPRAFWLVSDWGAGADGFIASIFKDAVSSAPFYRIDFSTFTERNDFLASIKPRLGFNFEQFIEALSENGRATFILDGVPPTGSGAEGSLEHDIEALVQIVIQYCPDVIVILRTMSRPRGASLPVVELGPLDEADLRNYILDHSLGGETRASLQDVSSIFRHTDGVPARVDAALKDLEVVSVSQLGHTNRDLINTPAERSEAPDALARAVSELDHSSDPVRARAFQLLKALAAFPQGERLERVHRFYGPHGVSTLHARELLDASLLTSVSVAGSAPAQETDSAPLLLVPRPVRDHVRSTLKSHELVDLTKDAAKLYFGDKWQEGKIRPSIAQAFGRHDADNFEIVNASTILTRLLTDAIAAESDRDIEAALAIGSGFMAAIAKGDHYRSVIAFARDFLPLIPDEKGATRQSIEYEYARALRMTGTRQTRL